MVDAMQRAGDKLQLCKPPAKRVLNRGENISEAAVAEDIASIGSKLKTLAVWITINVHYPVNIFVYCTLYSICTPDKNVIPVNTV